MGLFKKKVSEEELAAQEANRSVLDSFNATKVLGARKFDSAHLFAYDEEKRQFLVTFGTKETLKDDNPYVISYDQVEDVYLEIEENWTDEPGDYAIAVSHGILTQDRYKEVYWHYKLFMNIVTSHPYAGHIRYQMNEKDVVVQVPSRNFMFRRGLELSGEFRGPEIREQRVRMEDLAIEEAEAIKRGKVFDFVTGQRPDGIFDKLVEDFGDDVYIKRLDRIAKHIKRAGRISRILKG